jgi:phospholipase/carboxylesterase
MVPPPMDLALDCVEVDPGDADSAVIWMHGLGDRGQSFVPIVPHLGVPTTRFVFPNAPERAVTINGGFVMPSWYDVRSLGPGPNRESTEEIQESAALILAVVEAQRQLGIPAERLVLAGFSQGGAMALHVASRYTETLAGILVLSAYLLHGDDFADARTTDNANTPVLFCHGSADPTVPMRSARAAHDRLREVDPDRPLEWTDYPMGHELGLDEIRRVGQWLRERLESVSGV